MKRVRVIKEGHPSYWYAHRIGEVFDVMPHEFEDFPGCAGFMTLKNGFIYSRDCEVLE